MLTLYSMQTSGNSYKPRLLFAHLRLPFRIVDVDTMNGETRTGEYLALNPIGKAPMVLFEDGRRLAESNAILLHFAEGSRFLPGDPFDRAKCYEWLFFEQYCHEPSLAVRRSLRLYPQRRHLATPERMEELLKGGNEALAVMEGRLSGHDWLAGEAFSVADISLYAYTHDAEENGGYDMSLFPGVAAWLERVAAEPGHVPVDWRPR
ncbi:glutathione S-transferase family protein [Afifella sp. IM 167]|uniref:glutathione S-transferase family protein n=1 Tax=Afifella sp. IM 167 TaxID=2033586 RepID=UPI001CCF2BAE|nr:glutathione S-transferase family protein [Afifella sp. IM 167]MBZ8132168.1 glutathione S-transferase [Afifella sp. IM 167]